MYLSRLRPTLPLLAFIALALIGCSSLRSASSLSDIALAEENYKLKTDLEKIRQQLASQKELAVNQRPDAEADLKARLEVSEEKLAAAVRSYAQSQEEAGKLRTDLEQARGEVAALTAQTKDLEAKLQAAASASPRPAPNAVPAPAPSAESSDAEANLATALRTYAIVRDENDQLRAERDRLVSEAEALKSQVNALQGAVPIAAQVQGIRDQLRQTQAQSAVYAEENARLKSALALAGPSPGSTYLPAATTVTAVPVSVTPDALAPTPTPTPVPTPAAPRTHTVGAGDTLSRIALQYYGAASRWPEILDANRDTLRDEKGLIVGRKLRIP